MSNVEVGEREVFIWKVADRSFRFDSLLVSFMMHAWCLLQ